MTHTYISHPNLPSLFTSLAPFPFPFIGLPRRLWFSDLLLATRSNTNLPVQVTYKSDKNTEAKKENRSSNSDFQYLTKTKGEKGK